MRIVYRMIPGLWVRVLRSSWTKDRPKCSYCIYLLCAILQGGAYDTYCIPFGGCRNRSQETLFVAPTMVACSGAVISRCRYRKGC